MYTAQQLLAAVGRFQIVEVLPDGSNRPLAEAEAEYPSFKAALDDQQRLIAKWGRPRFPLVIKEKTDE